MKKAKVPKGRKKALKSYKKLTKAEEAKSQGKKKKAARLTKASDRKRAAGHKAGQKVTKIKRVKY